MLEVFHLLSFGLGLVSGILLILGLIRPVLVLWFMDRFNRLKVIQVYGIAMLIFLGVSFLFQMIG
jgi:predicted membrane channel-forming protein YqfA (hemolysin III family)